MVLGLLLLFSPLLGKLLRRLFPSRLTSATA
jgi:hypothetical protein